MENLTGLPYVTIPELQILRKAPGEVYIKVRQVSEYWVPMAYHTDADQVSTVRGVIVNGVDVIGSNNLEDLLEAVRITFEDIRIEVIEGSPEVSYN